MVLLCLFAFWGGDVKRWGSLQYFSFRTTIVLAFAWYSGAQKEMQPEEPLLCMASMLSPDVIFLQRARGIEASWDLVQPHSSNDSEPE